MDTADILEAQACTVPECHLVGLILPDTALNVSRGSRVTDIDSGSDPKLIRFRSP